MTQENLKVYQQSKNVDSVTILSFRYFEFLNVFFKKNVDILSLQISDETHLYAMLTTNLLFSYSKV